MNALSFLGPPATVTIDSVTNKVHVVTSQAFRAEGGDGNDLDVYVGYRKIGTTVYSTVGIGVLNVEYFQQKRAITTLNGILSNLQPGIYEVGMVGRSADINWTEGQNSYTSAIVLN